MCVRVGAWLGWKKFMMADKWTYGYVRQSGKDVGMRTFWSVCLVFCMAGDVFELVVPQYEHI